MRQNVRISNRGLIREDEKKFWSHPTATENYEQGLAFKMDFWTELFTRLATNLFGEGKFYKESDKDGRITAENQDDELLKLIRIAAKEDVETLMKLLAYSRNELYLRTIPVIGWVEAAVARAGMDNSVLRQYAPSILKRADEPAEAIAYYIAKNGSFLGDGGRYPGMAQKGVILSHSLRKGIEDVIFENFDEYQIKKYDKKNAAVKMRDVINLVHPNPHTLGLEHDGKSEWQQTFKAVLAGTLEPATTWEDTLMNWKQKGFKSKKEAWESIVPKMGVFAIVRNLRNLVEAGISDAAAKTVIDTLNDVKKVSNSKLFPYRFYSAYTMLEQTSTTNTHLRQKFQTALEDAISISVDNNIPKWHGKTMIASDWSYSMRRPVSEKSITMPWDISGLMLCMAAKLCDDAICSIFAHKFQVVNIHERSGILDNLQRIKQIEVGSATMAYLSLLWLIENNIKVDRFVLLSDMQCYDLADKDEVATPAMIQEAINLRAETTFDPYTGRPQHRSQQFAPMWNYYRKTINPDAYLYTFDLSGYGTIQVPADTPNLFVGAGFSDKILSMVPMFESDRQTAVERIKSTVTPDTYRKKKQQRKNQEEQEDAN